MDVNPYNLSTGRTRYGDRCPICGVKGVCPDAADVPMPLPPFEIGDHDPPAGPLRPYAVTVNGYPTEMNLSDSDAARYGADAVPI